MANITNLLRAILVLSHHHHHRGGNWMKIGGFPFNEAKKVTSQPLTQSKGCCNHSGGNSGGAGFSLRNRIGKICP